MKQPHDYNLKFARKCLELGVLAGRCGAKVNYAGRRGSSKHWPWQVYKANEFSQTYKTAEETQAFLEGYLEKQKASR